MRILLRFSILRSHSPFSISVLILRSQSLFSISVLNLCSSILRMIISMSPIFTFSVSRKQKHNQPRLVYASTCSSPLTIRASFP